MKKALLLGFFSTFGDLDVLDVVKGWLVESSIDFDVAPYSSVVKAALENSIDPKDAIPENYTHLIVVCGPLREYRWLRSGLDFRKFSHCVSIGVNLTMVDSVAEWNPFDYLIERDSDRNSIPDLAFSAPVEFRPVLGLCFVPDQKEYGDRQNHAFAEERLRSLAHRNNASVIALDTRWPIEDNECGLHTSADFHSIVSRVDVLLTTRLHGMVFSLRAGKPVIALDPIIGGDKVTRQAKSLNWPYAWEADKVSDRELDTALENCLKPAIERSVAQSNQIAALSASKVLVEFREALNGEPGKLGCSKAPHQPKRSVYKRIRKKLRSLRPKK
ncbi:MAG: polysaccharide pyruvyl transferase family protein [Opitutaceae bacterium]